jgi:colanic acid biosynthesis glycosyl transferase WcaI
MSETKTPRIAIITSNYWPERTGIGQVTTEFAEFLAAEGIEVRVATAMPYYPEWSIYPEYRGKVWQTERHNGVLIHRAAHYASPTPSTFGRILHEATLCVASLPNMVRALWGAKAAFVVSPDLSHAFVGCVVARAMGVRLTLVVQDIMPDAAVEMGMLTNKFVIAVSRMLAGANYAMAQTIYTLSEGMKARIARLTGHAEKIEIVPNTIDCDELAPGPDQGKPFRDRFVPEGTFAVVHTGNMGEKQDLNLLLRTARRLLDRSHIHFYVFGDGAAKAEFLATKEKWNLANVSHFPLQDRSLLPHMLYGADICVVSQLSSVIDVVVPSKLLTSMGAGALIVAACSSESETARMVNASCGGFITASSDDKALANLIEKLLLDPGVGKRERYNARGYAASSFDRRAVYTPVVKMLREPSLGLS